MKHTTLSSIAFGTLIIMACHSTKKSSAPAVAAAPAPAATTSTTASTPAPVAAGPLLPLKAGEGIVVPGETELAAIRAKYKDVPGQAEISMETLKEGHAIYTGQCTGCHMAFSVYPIQETHLPRLIDDMAMRARINAQQKDAVMKYVLAIKATQVK